MYYSVKIEKESGSFQILPLKVSNIEAMWLRHALKSILPYMDFKEIEDYSLTIESCHKYMTEMEIRKLFHEVKEATDIKKISVVQIIEEEVNDEDKILIIE